MVKVDSGNRYLTIKDQEGTEVTIKVPVHVQSLEQIQPGERLRVRYAQSLALAIGKPGEGPVEEQETMRMAPRSGAPGETVVQTKSLTGRVESVDRSKREIAIERPEGGMLKLQVPQGTPGFDEVKEGDTAFINYTEAVALAVERQEGRQ